MTIIFLKMGLICMIYGDLLIRVDQTSAGKGTIELGSYTQHSGEQLDV